MERLQTFIGVAAVSNGPHNDIFTINTVNNSPIADTEPVKPGIFTREHFTEPERVNRQAFVYGAHDLVNIRWGQFRDVAPYYLSVKVDFVSLVRVSIFQTLGPSRLCMSCPVPRQAPKYALPRRIPWHPP